MSRSLPSLGAGLADGQQLGMGGRVAQLERAVAGRCQDLARAIDDHRSRSAPRRRRRAASASASASTIGSGACSRVDLQLRRHGRAKRDAVKAERMVRSAERIAKAIAQAGLCSRRDAERLIAEGRVTVNGKTLATPAHHRGGFATRSRSTASRCRRSEGAAALALPQAAWTGRQPQGSARAQDGVRRAPAAACRASSRSGRLDLNTEGLLLLTNDGALARHLELPSHRLAQALSGARVWQPDRASSARRVARGHHHRRRALRPDRGADRPRAGRQCSG